MGHGNGLARTTDTSLSLCADFTGVVHSIRLETVIAAPPGDCFGLSLSVDAPVTLRSRPRAWQRDAGTETGDLRATSHQHGSANLRS